MGKTLQVKEKREALKRQTFRAFSKEFLFVLFIGIISVVAQSLYAQEAYEFHLTLKSYLLSHESKIIQVNKTVYYCKVAKWKKEHVESAVTFYNAILFTYFFVLAISGVTFIIHVFLWLFYLYKIDKDPEYAKEHPRVTLAVRSIMGFVRNMAQDIPLSCLGADLFAQRRGTKGLACIVCSVTPTCVDNDFIFSLLNPSSQWLTVLLLMIVFSTVWKGICGFFRWSHTKECPAVSLRGCASIFVGLLYACIVITPCIAIFRFRYLTLDGVSNLGLQAFLDKLLLMGMIAWGVVFIITVCCPLIHSIRLTDS